MVTSAPSVVDRDVLVVGGGPAGSTVAALLAERGWSVALVERARHPRFHIGESLLPMNLPIFERLGVLDQVAAIGVKKEGADFAAAPAGGCVSYPFAHALGDSPSHAFQVHRAELDELLFRHAEAKGVDGHEGMTIHRLSFDGDRVAADGADESGHKHRFTARYLVDATGRATLAGRQLGVEKRRPRHKSAALFAHFRGVTPAPGDERGNILVHRIPEGWAWLIPLTGGITSVGVVCDPTALRGALDDRRARLDRLLLRAPAIAQRIAGATLEGQPHTASNYSYRHAHIAGRRWVMVGDAFGFLDPVFSSGVYLAMKSAELAAGVVDRSLRDPRREAIEQRAYAATMQHSLDTFEWFVERFNTDAMDLLLQQPNNQAQIVQAIISMLAGDVFDREVRRRLLAFKVIYQATRIDALRIRLTDALLGRMRWSKLIGDRACAPMTPTPAWPPAARRWPWCPQGRERPSGWQRRRAGDGS